MTLRIHLEIFFQKLFWLSNLCLISEEWFEFFHITVLQYRNYKETTMATP